MHRRSWRDRHGRRLATTLTERPARRVRPSGRTDGPGPNSRHSNNHPSGCNPASSDATATPRTPHSRWRWEMEPAASAWTSTARHSRRSNNRPSECSPASGCDANPVPRSQHLRWRWGAEPQAAASTERRAPPKGSVAARERLSRDPNASAAPAWQSPRTRTSPRSQLAAQSAAVDHRAAPEWLSGLRGAAEGAGEASIKAGRAGCGNLPPPKYNHPSPLATSAPLIIQARGPQPMSGESPNVAAFGSPAGARE